MYVGGKLYPKQDFITILYGIIGDDLYPVLFTFNKSGTKIDSLDLCPVWFGDGPGYQTSSVVHFGDNCTIIKIDETRITEYNDSTGIDIPNTDTTKVCVQIYQLKNNGTFAKIDSAQNIFRVNK